MVYKKYIKRGGKLYGPYYYESERVDGRVITKYVEKPSSLNKLDLNVDFDKIKEGKKFLPYILIGAVLIVALVLGFTFKDNVNFSPDERAIFHIEKKYAEGSYIQGQVLIDSILNLSNTDITVSLNNKTYSALLVSLMDNQIEGN